VSLKTGLLVSDIWSDLVYLRYYVIVFYRFCSICWSWSDILCIIHCRQSKSAIISEIMVTHNLPDLRPPNSPDLKLTTESGATCLPDKSAECEW